MEFFFIFFLTLPLCFGRDLGKLIWVLCGTIWKTFASLDFLLSKKAKHFIIPERGRGAVESDR